MSTQRKNADPSRHTPPPRAARAKSRRVGPSETQLAQQPPQRRGHRTAAPKRPRVGQPPGHVGAR